MRIFIKQSTNYKSLFFILAVFICISCSTTKVAYNFANVWVVNWFESYFNFRESQRVELEKKLDQFFDWHRKSELPKIVLFLEDFKMRHKDGFDKDDINWVKSELNLFWERILINAEKDIASFLLTVDDSQIFDMNKNFQEKEDDTLTKQSKMSLVELNQDILRRTYKALENWLGDLEPSQKEKIEIWTQTDPYWVIVKLKNREKFQSDLIELLRSKDTLKQNIHSWISNPESHWTDEYKAIINTKIKEWEIITIRIDSIILPRQRKHVAEKVEDIILDLKELSGI
ncbi:MAG: DUF6279 family lipoprotein [Alphaproteobacteria bacterium]|nr:DUF6279 family lipoprotein [Alphaproteobacteria bacterium]